MPYKVGLKYTSTFSDGQMHYYIKATNKSTNVTAEYTGTTNKTVQGNTTYTGYSHGTLKKRKWQIYRNGSRRVSIKYK